MKNNAVQQALKPIFKTVLFKKAYHLELLGLGDGIAPFTTFTRDTLV